MITTVNKSVCLLILVLTTSSFGFLKDDYYRDEVSRRNVRGSRDSFTNEFSEELPYRKDLNRQANNGKDRVYENLYDRRSFRTGTNRQIQIERSDGFINNRERSNEFIRDDRNRQQSSRIVQNREPDTTERSSRRIQNRRITTNPNYYERNEHIYSQMRTNSVRRERNLGDRIRIEPKIHEYGRLIVPGNDRRQEMNSLINRYLPRNTRFEEMRERRSTDFNRNDIRSTNNRVQFREKKLEDVTERKAKNVRDNRISDSKLDSYRMSENIRETRDNRIRETDSRDAIPNVRDSRDTIRNVRDSRDAIRNVRDSRDAIQNVRAKGYVGNNREISGEIRTSDNVIKERQNNYVRNVRQYREENFRQNVARLQIRFRVLQEKIGYDRYPLQSRFGYTRAALSRSDSNRQTSEAPINFKEDKISEKHVFRSAPINFKEDKISEKHVFRSNRDVSSCFVERRILSLDRNANNNARYITKERNYIERQMVPILEYEPNTQKSFSKNVESEQTFKLDVLINFVQFILAVYLIGQIFTRSSKSAVRFYGILPYASTIKQKID